MHYRLLVKCEGTNDPTLPVMKVKTRDITGKEKYLSVSGETKAELYNVLSKFGVSEGRNMDVFTTHCCECAEIVYTQKNGL